MHHTYITSTLLSIGTHHGSISVSSNDCSSNLFCERFGRTPFALSLPPSSSHSHSPQCCSCCACCSCCGSPSLSKSSFAIKPSFLLYGLRQSSLIQCPPSRRMNLGGRTWCYDRAPGYGFDLGGYEVPCSFEESSGRERIGGRRKEVRPRPVNSQQRRRCLDSANDADAVINLLSEEVSEEYLDHRRRTGEFSERLQKVRQGSYVGGECESQRNKQLRLRLLASKSRCEFESNTNEFKKEESRMKEERNEKKKKDSRDVYRGENSKARTGSASLSSYYSLSSEEEFENDEEVHEEEPSTGYMNELDESSSQGQVVGAFEKHPEDSEKQKEVSEHRTRVSSIEWDLRKKSEKKLTDFEETEYIKHSSQLQSRTDSTHEDNHMKSMNSGTKIDDFSHEYKVSDDKEESAVVVSQEKRATARYNQRGNNKVEKQAEVRRNSQQVTGRQDIHETDNGAASRYHRLSPGGEGMVGRSGKDRSSSSHELLKNTDMGNAGLGTVSTFQKQSESRTKTQEERKALSSYWEVSDKRDQIGPSKVMGEVESTMSSKQSPQMSEGHQQYRGKSYSQHSESEAKGQRFPRTDQKPLERVQSRKGPKDATNLTVNLTNVSLVNTSSNTETVVNSQRNSQQIIVNQGGDDTSTAKPIQETGARRPLLVHEPQGVRKTSSLRRRTSERASSPQTSEEAIEGIRSEAVMVPPSHQLVARSSFREDPAGGVQVQDVSEGDMSVPGIRQEPQYGDLEEGGFNDNSLYLHNPGDVLGSARRQEESSMQYVGEFVERARHHEPSSEAEVSKGNNSRGSSADSGEKGPSDEIWDVRNPSVHEPPKAEAAEELQGTNEAGSSVVTERSTIRKTGKSMWAIIGDIVRLRWSSPRAETSKSTGGKTSSNDSAASEAWFSGRDPDERSEGTLKKETSSSDQVLISHTSSQRRGEASDTGETKRMASPSIILKSGSTSRGFTSPAGEKDLDFSPEGKRSQVAPSSVRLGETPSISLPLSARSSPIVKPSLDTHKSDASASGSGEKDGEVKGRKLQRNKQVIRDSFDDWEEAYIRESEQRKIDEMFMREALVEAKKAADIWEVPVGAVLVQHGKIIARGYNLVEELRDSTAHAEMICIREGSNQLRSWRLAETTLYVTLEPCTMCAGAILQARIDTLVWGAPNKLLGADGSWIRIFPNGEGGSGLETDKPPPPVHPFHPKMTIRRGILAADCADVMQSFFQLRRKTKINNSKEEQQQQHSPQNSLVRVSNHPSKILKKMHDIFHVMFCL